jgi:hypothetical protein
MCDARGPRPRIIDEHRVTAAPHTDRLVGVHWAACQGRTEYLLKPRSRGPAEHDGGSVPNMALPGRVTCRSRDAEDCKRWEIIGSPCKLRCDAFR